MPIFAFSLSKFFASIGSRFRVSCTRRYWSSAKLLLSRLALSAARVACEDCGRHLWAITAIAACKGSELVVVTAFAFFAVFSELADSATLP